MNDQLWSALQKAEGYIGAFRREFPFLYVVLLSYLASLNDDEQSILQRSTGEYSVVRAGRLLLGKVDRFVDLSQCDVRETAFLLEPSHGILRMVELEKLDRRPRGILLSVKESSPSSTSCRCMLYPQQMMSDRVFDIGKKARRAFWHTQK